MLCNWRKDAHNPHFHRRCVWAIVRSQLQRHCGHCYRLASFIHSNDVATSAWYRWVTILICSHYIIWCKIRSSKHRSHGDIDIIDSRKRIAWSGRSTVLCLLLLTVLTYQQWTSVPRRWNEHLCSVNVELVHVSQLDRRHSSSRHRRELLCSAC